ncbi:hypothetical protein GCM10010917_09860 [Paenibacillus physcomitrellae]|uniref:Uncharacterized protein n=1 Tax=Paenibacillus physcomitrellae TaxID=1619311 RepID=A0ABQ1FQS5_9BACL|nr:hypothetical protein GCM10010917_09860 [Paenibacillus physcomitrellae]
MTLSVSSLLQADTKDIPASTNKTTPARLNLPLLNKTIHFTLKPAFILPYIGFFYPFIYGLAHFRIIPNKPGE